MRDGEKSLQMYSRQIPDNQGVDDMKDEPVEPADAKTSHRETSQD